MLQAMAPGAEVVHQFDVRNLQIAFEMRGFHDPREIGGANLAVDYRTGDAKSRGVNIAIANVRSCQPREFFDDQIELRKFFASEALAEDGCEFSAFFREQRQVAFCPADITCKNHRGPQKNLKRPLASRNAARASHPQINDKARRGPAVTTADCASGGRRARSMRRIPPVPSFRTRTAGPRRFSWRSTHRE